MTTIITAADQPSYALTPGNWRSPSGVEYLLIPLSTGTEAESVGLVALAVRTQPIPQHYWELSAAISIRLLELSDLALPSRQ